MTSRPLVAAVLCVCGISAALFHARPAGAAAIVQNVSNEERTIFPWVGQSFTAEDPFIGIAGAFVTDFTFFAVATDTSIQYELYEGSGIGGTLLATRVFSGLFEGFEAFADVSFSGIPLVVGATYSLIVRNDTGEWGVDSAFGDFYTGGELLLPTDDGFGFAREMRFHIFPAAVPEPATLLVFGGGVAVVVWRRRARS